MKKLVLVNLLLLIGLLCYAITPIITPEDYNKVYNSCSPAKSLSEKKAQKWVDSYCSILGIESIEVRFDDEMFVQEYREGNYLYGLQIHNNGREFIALPSYVFNSISIPAKYKKAILIHEITHHFINGHELDFYAKERNINNKLYGNCLIDEVISEREVFEYINPIAKPKLRSIIKKQNNKQNKPTSIEPKKQSTTLWYYSSK